MLMPGGVEEESSRTSGKSRVAISFVPAFLYSMCMHGVSVNLVFLSGITSVEYMPDMHSQLASASKCDCCVQLIGIS